MCGPGTGVLLEEPGRQRTSRTPAPSRCRTQGVTTPPSCICYTDTQGSCEVQRQQSVGMKAALLGVVAPEQRGGGGGGGWAGSEQSQASDGHPHPHQFSAPSQSTCGIEAQGPSSCSCQTCPEPWGCPCPCPHPDPTQTHSEGGAHSLLWAAPELRTGVPAPHDLVHKAAQRPGQHRPWGLLPAPPSCQQIGDPAQGSLGLIPGWQEAKRLQIHWPFNLAFYRNSPYGDVQRGSMHQGSHHCSVHKRARLGTT